MTEKIKNGEDSTANNFPDEIPRRGAQNNIPRRGMQQDAPAVEKTTKCPE